MMERKVWIALAFLGVCGCALGVPVGGNTSRSYSLLPKDCGRSPLFDAEPVDRIIGGRRVPAGRYPFMISLRERDPDDPSNQFTHVCGGSIINKYWILTAAHCPIYKYQNPLYKVLVGLSRINELSDPFAKLHEVEKILIHKSYKDTANNDDICLIQLKTPIQFNNRVQPVCLPRGNKGDSQLTGNVDTSGWGWTKDGGPDMSEHLMVVTVPIIERGRCNKWYDPDLNDGKDEITNGMICAGRQGKDSCQYDSGGPLFKEVDGRLTLYGIVSFGGKCGFGPGVYTNVAYYMDWITENMQ